LRSAHRLDDDGVNLAGGCVTRGFGAHIVGAVALEERLRDL